MRPLVLLDRDGTINREVNYLSRPEELELLPGAAEGIQRLNALGCPVVVVTNQSGLGRGYFDQGTLERIHVRLRELLAEAGAAVDGIVFCPHVPEDACTCRKPEPGLAEAAAKAVGGDLDGAFVVGDKLCDVEFGRRVGATTFLVSTGYGAGLRDVESGFVDYWVADLREAAEQIEEIVRVRGAPEGKR